MTSAFVFLSGVDRRLVTTTFGLAGVAANLQEKAQERNRTADLVLTKDVL